MQVQKVVVLGTRFFLYRQLTMLFYTQHFEALKTVIYRVKYNL